MIEKCLPSETYSLLIDLLRQTIGEQVDLVNSRLVNQHHDYFALFVTTRNPSYELAIKIAGQEAPYPYPFDRTAALHQLVAAQTSILMPEVIAVDVSCHTYPWRYMIKTYIPGQEWAVVKQQLNATEQVEAYQQMGTAVAELHQIQFDYFGDIDTADTLCTSAIYLSALHTRVNSIIKVDRYREAFLQLLEARRNLFMSIVQPRLCHEDLHQYNILFQQQAGCSRLATILDFDKAWAGHYETDLAKLELWKNMTGDGFWEAYHGLMPQSPEYPLRRPIYQLLWCLEYAANTPQHLADTQKLCKELHFPAIERFE